MSEIYNSWNMRQINHMTATHKRILRNLIYPQRRSLKYFTVGCLGGQITMIRLRKKINLIQIIFDFLGLNSNWKPLDFAKNKFPSGVIRTLSQKTDCWPPGHPTTQWFILLIENWIFAYYMGLLSTKNTFWHKAFLVVWQWIEVSYVQIPCREFMISTNASSSSWRCHVICVWQRRSWIKIPFPPLFTCDLSKSHISWIVFKLESPLNTISIAVVNHLIRPRKSNFVSL